MDEKKFEELIKKIEEDLIKEYKKDKDKIEKSDKDDIKSGFIMAINNKFIFFKDKNANNNIMEAGEALRLLNNIKYIIKQVGVDISDSGYGWFIANNIKFEIVYSDIISETSKNPAYMDDIYLKRKVKDEYLFSHISMTTKKKPIASVTTEENSKTDDK